MTSYSLPILKGMWKNLSNIPIDKDECIEEDFYTWAKGTSRFEIWKWFDDNLEGGLKKHFKIKIFHPNMLCKKSNKRLEKEIQHLKRSIEYTRTKGMDKALDKKDYNKAKMLCGRIKVLEKRLRKRKVELENRE